MDVAPKGFKRKVFLWARRQIFDAIHHVFLSEKLNNLIEIVGVKLIENATPSYVIEEHSRQTTKNVLFVLKKKWKNAHNTKNRFLEGNKSWLDDSTNIAEDIDHVILWVWKNGLTLDPDKTQAIVVGLTSSPSLVTLASFSLLRIENRTIPFSK
ncbi:uncharacterized protein LOC117172998 isoform X1 [Belonocnema kinseyi]|uniref:uncharacterized protein LOC117172998 isoform X1 n=1 Tax=Belonocnema kinseyi TaxID=2817044 RepID=UPI00143D21DE|nr:uncharacterized protein LOC117172998 isoform X1 [Belonocnema kinseyi]